MAGYRSEVGQGQSRLLAEKRICGVQPSEWPHFPGANTNPGPQRVGLARLGLGVSGSRPFSIFTGHTASAVAPTSLGLLVCKMGPVIPPGQVQGLR